MTERRIDTEADIAEGCAWLAARCEGMAAARARCGPPPLRRRPPGFATLLRAVVGQQLSVASATAVWSRLEAAGGSTEAGIDALDDAALRAAGLSRQKIATARALAAARIDYAALAAGPEDAALATLTALRGIGRWTAEIYLLVGIGRADVMPADDLALQEAARLLYALPERPRPTALREMAEVWSPWRSVAARLLWAYYAAAKDREGLGA